MISHHFSTFSGASQYQFVQENDARKLALYLLEDGSNFHRQMQLYALSFANLFVSYGGLQETRKYDFQSHIRISLDL